MKLKLGIISLGSVSTQMLMKEAEDLFDVVKLIDLRKIEIKIDRGITVLYDGKSLDEFDCLYMKGSYKYSNILYGLSEIYKNKCYVPIDSNAHIIAHNKFLTHLNFAPEKDLKMPGTYFAVKVSESKEFLKTLNYPIILKFPTGTHGKGVVFTESSQSAISMVDALDIFKQPVLIQDYINIKSDIRIIVAGNKIVGSMKRIANKDDIRANAHQGGNAINYVPTPEIKNISLSAAKKIKADICAVDIIESDYGPLILEINTSPGLQKITETTKTNISREIAKALFDETKKLKEKKQKVTSRSVMNSIGIKEIGAREFEAELRVSNEKIVLPDFAYKMSKFNAGEDVLYRISENKIEIIRTGK